MDDVVLRIETYGALKQQQLEIGFEAKWIQITKKTERTH